MTEVVLFHHAQGQTPGFLEFADDLQALTQTRPGARGAVLFHGAVPAAEFEHPWPEGVPLQMHVMEGDAWGDVHVCRALAEQVPSAELFVYPGSGHLFADSGSRDYEPECALLLMARTLTFLSTLS